MLRERGAGVGLTTVYRTLQALADSGEVDVLRASMAEAVYRRCSTGHHHHLVCRNCGRTVEVEGPAVERWADRVAAEHGFVDVSHTWRSSAPVRPATRWAVLLRNADLARRRARSPATGVAGRSPATTCRGRRAPRTPTATAGSWTCAARRRIARTGRRRGCRARRDDWAMVRSSMRSGSSRPAATSRAMALAASAISARPP